MATTLTSIHRANDSNGFAVSFQLDYTEGNNDFQMHVTHSSPGRIRETELDIPLTEIPELFKSLIQIMENGPAANSSWCSHCKGSGEVPGVSPGINIMCDACEGRGMA